PGIGQRVLSGIAPQERITPAGRFDSEPGRNLKGEAIVWIDYEAAVAIHRLRPAPPAERRPQRLASDSAEDRRISLGCVVVSAEFYDEVVAPLLGRRRGVVYVLPEMNANSIAAAASGRQL
ncbi:MAG TPA: L,D-transpeptidase, partial [Roseateles sp.]|nr:L,D-transpeptidase [Roseateles sp.]